MYPQCWNWRSWSRSFCFKIRKVTGKSASKQAIYIAPKSEKKSRRITCWSTNIQKPHLCCLLVNKVENIDCGQVWACPRMTVKVPFPVGDPAPPHIIRCSLDIHEFKSQTASRLVQPFQPTAVQPVVQPAGRNDLNIINKLIINK